MKQHFCTALVPDVVLSMYTNFLMLFSQVDYSATAEELEQHFHGCGAVNRVTILCDKFSGHPKGFVILYMLAIHVVVIIWHSHSYFPCRFAYIEFTDKDSVETAVTMDDSLFKGRQIKVHYAIVY